MFRLFKKKFEAVHNWHSRAMLINPNRTKITIVNTTASSQNDFAENM